MKKYIFVCSVLLLASCASVSETYTADGKKAYALNCSGTARGWDKCLKAAGEICGIKGYKILDRTGEKAAFASGSSSGSTYSNSGSIFGSSSSSFSAVETQERSMLVTCKK